jgi:exopolysaccharide biosynthesis polyprenyl glycosylphosphotransferase
MPSKNTKLYSLILIIADFIVLLLAFSLAYIIRVQYDHRPLIAQIYAEEYFTTFLLIAPFWIIIFASLGLYQAHTYNRRLVEWSKIAIGVFIGILLVIGWQFASGHQLFPARLVAVYSLIATFVLVIIEREILRLTRSLLFYFGRGISRVLVIGDSAATRDIADKLADTHRSGYKIVAIAGPKKVIPLGLSVEHFTSVDSALKQIKELRINTIIQTDLYDSTDRNQRILGAAQVHHISYSFIPGEAEFYTGKNTVDVFLGYPIISVSQTPLVGWGAMAKRLFDIIASLLLIIVLSPVFLVTMLLQLIFNPGPIFYKSMRLTRYSQPFGMYKFRSMSAKYGKKDAVAEFREMGRDDLAKEYEANFKVDNDPRITKFGRFLRSSSIDELPQLFNVLGGSLSLVGPRPIPKRELDSKFAAKHGALLLSVKSGVTGLWQVSGRSETTTEERVQIELFYAQNWSFWLDMKILFRTISVVLLKRGAK